MGEIGEKSCFLSVFNSVTAQIIVIMHIHKTDEQNLYFNKNE